MNESTRLISQKYCFLSGSLLKVLAVFTMLIDHTAAFLLRSCEFAIQPLVSIGSHELSLYKIMRYVGRMAFPIFVFLLVEGFYHTHDKKKYGRNLLIFAIISEIPWNLLHSGTLLYYKQNVFFTLLLGYIGMCVIEKYQSLHKAKQSTIALLLILLIVSLLLQADYGVVGFGYVLLIYILRENSILQAVLGTCFLPSTWIGGMAFIPINLYNGKRGFIKGNAAKYFFYIFYPLHMICLYIIRNVLI